MPTRIQYAILLLCFTILASSLPTPIGLSATWVNIDIDTAKVIGTNSFQTGFQLNGDDLYRWRTRTELQQLAEDANFKLVRFFNNRVEPCEYWYESSKTGRWDWSAVDDLIEDIIATGAEPLVMLGFYSWAIDGISTPRGMAKSSITGLPYPDSWAAYSAEWVKHFKEKGYPVVYYEIVNEAYHYWKDDGWPIAQPKLSYFTELFNAAAKAMRAQNSNIKISTDCIIMKGVLEYFISNGERLDYLSYHGYGTGSIYTSDAEVFEAAETLYIGESNSYWGVDRAVELYKQMRGIDLKVIKSENNLNYVYTSGTDTRIQKMQGAIYQALTFRTFMLKGYLYNVYFHFTTSASDWSREPTGGYGVGMVNMDNNEPWYPYYVHEMIGNSLSVGDRIYETQSSSNNIRVIAWNHNNRLKIMLISKSTSDYTINLNGVSGTLSYQKLDNAVSYRDPRIQTGNVYSSSSFNLNGYTVMLLDGDLSSPPPPPPPPPSPNVDFEDGFESGNFNAWSTTYTSGGSASVSSSISHHGSEAAVFETYGGSRDFAQSIKYINDDEIYLRAYINFDSLPLSDNGDRLYFLRFMSDDQWLAGAGIRRDAGVDKWIIVTRSGYSWVGPYYALSPDIEEGRWYCVELHWKRDRYDGTVELYVDGNKIIERTGLNTDTYGNADQMEVGNFYTTNVQGGFTITADCVAASDAYIGEETAPPPPPPPEPSESFFTSDFESRNWDGWNGIETSSGDTATVVDWGAHEGSYHGRYLVEGSSSSENAYSYKSVNENEIYVQGYFRIPRGTPLQDENDRFYLIRLRAGSQWLAGAGIRRNNGQQAWVIYARDGSSWEGPEMDAIPSINGDRYYLIELHWKRGRYDGVVEMFVDGTKVLEITGINTDYYGNVNNVDVGIAGTTSVQQEVIVYADDIEMSNGYIG